MTLRECHVQRRSTQKVALIEAGQHGRRTDRPRERCGHGRARRAVGFAVVTAAAAAIAAVAVWPTLAVGRLHLQHGDNDVHVPLLRRVLQRRLLTRVVRRRRRLAHDERLHRLGVPQLGASVQCRVAPAVHAVRVGACRQQGLDAARLPG